MTNPPPDDISLTEQIHDYGLNQAARVIYLHSAFDEKEEEPGIDWRVATTFIKNMHILESQGKAPILIKMICCGGDWHEGMAIFDAIRCSPCPVTILAYSPARSMSGVILQAADKRILMPNCVVMIHHGSMGVEESSVAAASFAEQNRQDMRKMLNIFSERARNSEYFAEKNRSAIEKYIDRKCKDKGDWYIDAEEAVKYGFADLVYDYRKGYDTIRAKRKWHE